MKQIPSLAIAGVLLAAASGAGRAADAMRMEPGAAMPTASPSPSGTGGPADRAFAASNEAMMKGMGVKPTGDADRDFVAMMLPHHEGAIAMAQVELRYGHDPMLRKLAAAIVKSQTAEVAEMQGWQKKRPE